MKILEELNIKRYETKINNEGYYSFGVQINEKKFIYLQSNPIQKESIEIWKNNFSSGYVIKLDNNLEKIVLFSIEGISIFDNNFNNRNDYNLNRNSPEYKSLEIFEKKKDFKNIEKIFEKILNVY